MDRIQSINKIVIIYHSIDLDGWMSAAIIKHAWNVKYHFEEDSLHFIGYNYGQTIPDLSEYKKVVMVDVSFPKEEMLKLRSNLGENFIWIDHHISAIKELIIDEQKKQVFEGLQNINYAACELTWMYFMENAYMENSYDYLDKNSIGFHDCHGSAQYIPEIVRLLGMYDSFRHKGLDEEQKVLEFQYGARQCISNYEEAYEYLIKCKKDFLYESGQYFDNTLNQIYDKGKAIYQYLCTEAKQNYNNGFEIIFDEDKEYRTGKTFKFICINKERFNPINFGIEYHKDGYDGCACFHYANGVFNFSLYNDNERVDCSSIAKQYGGGGHKGAAGFRLDKEQFLKIISNV